MFTLWHAISANQNTPETQCKIPKHRVQANGIPTKETKSTVQASQQTKIENASSKFSAVEFLEKAAAKNYPQGEK